VSRYRFDASHITIPDYKVVFEHWSDRGIKSYKSVLGAGAKAKTMTSLFTLLSVLCTGQSLSIACQTYVLTLSYQFLGFLGKNIGVLDLYSR
jgi:hypothetical protein